jgi:Domain of unknown function (DUF4062)
MSSKTVDDLKREGDLSPLAVNTVFISSTTRDLRGFRQAVAWVEQERWGVRESFPESEWSSVTTPGEIVAECRRRVLSADAFILILGPWAGLTPPGHTESITHLEFRWARSHFAELYQRIGEFAKKWNVPGLMSFYRPRIFVLTAGPHDLRRDISDGGRASFLIYRNIKQLLAEHTETELEGIETSLKKFHQEVSEAVHAGEATLSPFDDMEDMEEEVLEKLRQWEEFAAKCVQVIETSGYDSWYYSRAPTR